MRSLHTRLRTTLLAGLVVTVPAVVTVFALRFLFRNLDAVLGPWIARLVGREIPGLGIATTILLVLVAGLVATNVVGRRLVGWGEGLFARVPVVRRIYNASKDIVESATLSQRQVFKDVVLLEYPRKGVYAYGFVTSYTMRVSRGERSRVANVFLPSPPVPTTGLLAVVPVDDLVFLQLSTEEALKLILSIGMAVPEELVETIRNTDAIEGGGA